MINLTSASKINSEPTADSSSWSHDNLNRSSLLPIESWLPTAKEKMFKRRIYHAGACSVAHAEELFEQAQRANQRLLPYRGDLKLDNMEMMLVRKAKVPEGTNVPISVRSGKEFGDNPRTRLAHRAGGGYKEWFLLSVFSG